MTDDMARYRRVVRWVPNPLTGAIAGLIASIPMGFAMIGLNRLVSKERKEPEPPKQITEELADRAGMEEIVPRGRAWGLSTWLGHLGYGAATASLYPATAYHLPLPTALTGMLFAMAVWVGSYLGWLPAFDILPSSKDQPARRNAVMIGTHLLWGSLTGLLIEWIEKQATITNSISIHTRRSEPKAW